MAGFKTSRDELAAITYLDLKVIANRRVEIMPFWDGERWHMWIPGPNGLIHMNPLAAAEIDYIAKTPAANTDLHIPFVELMWQRMNWAPISPKAHAIASDFRNFGTSIEKLDFFHRFRSQFGLAISSVVQTELEYIFITARSVFDLLQEAFAILWSHVQLHDSHAEGIRKSRKMPDTFSKVVLKDKSAPKTEEELVASYALSPELARIYVSAIPFFSMLRRIRDGIVHSGKDVDRVFATDRGFCVGKGNSDIDALPIWRPEHDGNENIRSLAPLLAHVVLGTLQTCTDLMAAFASQIQLPAEMAPGYRVFVRGPNNAGLAWLAEVAQGGSPWWSDRSSRQAQVRELAYSLWETRSGERWWDADSNWLQAERELDPAMPDRRAAKLVSNREHPVRT